MTCAATPVRCTARKASARRADGLGAAADGEGGGGGGAAVVAAAEAESAVTLMATGSLASWQWQVRVVQSWIGFVRGALYFTHVTMNEKMLAIHH